MKTALYRIELLHESTGAYVDFEWDVEVKDEAEAKRYLDKDIFEDILSDISIIPELISVED